MELTGKAKEDFEKWLVCSSGSFDPYYSDVRSEDDPYKWFLNMPESMQWGVYVSFFDKVGVILDIQPVIAYDNSKYTEIELFLLNITKLNEVMEDTFFGDFKSRQKAQLAAIEKANEIYNSL